MSILGSIVISRYNQTKKSAEVSALGDSQNANHSALSVNNVSLLELAGKFKYSCKKQQKNRRREFRRELKLLLSCAWRCRLSSITLSKQKEHVNTGAHKRCSLQNQTTVFGMTNRYPSADCSTWNSNDVLRDKLCFEKSEKAFLKKRNRAKARWNKSLSLLWNFPRRGKWNEIRRFTRWKRISQLSYFTQWFKLQFFIQLYPLITFQNIGFFSEEWKVNSE